MGLRLFYICCILLISSVAKSQASSITPETLQKLKVKLELLYDRDEQYRLILDSVQTKFHMGSREYKEAFAQMQISDSINQTELIPIIDKYGWLGKSEVGDKANEAIFYVVHHSNQEVRIKYLPLMKVSVAKGESNPKHLDWLEDRILHNQGRPQKHNSQYYAVQREDGNFDYYEDLMKANEERRKEGLDTISAAQ